jgi:hypothetical protein
VSGLLHREHRRAVLGLLAAAIAALAVLGFAQTGPGRDALASAGLTGRDEGWTSLSFANALTLPRDLHKIAGHRGLAFVVENRHGGPRRYRWRIEATAPSGRTRTLAHGRVALAAGERRRLAPVLGQACAGPDGSSRRTRVVLAPPHHEIAYRAGCGPKGVPADAR